MLLFYDAYDILVAQKKFRKMLRDPGKHVQLASVLVFLPLLRFQSRHLSQLL
jgi:hypothetical protein